MGLHVSSGVVPTPDFGPPSAVAGMSWHLPGACKGTPVALNAYLHPADETAGDVNVPPIDILRAVAPGDYDRSMAAPCNCGNSVNDY